MWAFFFNHEVKQNLLLWLEIKRHAFKEQDAVGGGGGDFSQWGRWGTIFVQTSSNLFLKVLTEGAATTKAGSTFKYFTTLTEKTDINTYCSIANLWNASVKSGRHDRGYYISRIISCYTVNGAVFKALAYNVKCRLLWRDRQVGDGYERCLSKLKSFQYSWQCIP